MSSSGRVLASIPSPSQGVWHLGPFPVRAYALCIILGIIVCLMISERRWVARGGRPGTIGDIATWAVPFGLVGGRIYHVATDPELYFSHEHWNPVGALEVWNGGLGIWGAVGFGALGAWIACRRRGIPLYGLADTVAPGIVIAQAIGRWGNYFNQELYGGKSGLPWALHITRGDAGNGYFQPTFLYESLWDIGVAGLCIWADKRWRLGHGRVFAIYVLAYTAGRGWIEYLRTDTVNHFLGLRLNDWTSLLLFLGALLYLYLTRGYGREAVVDPRPDKTVQPAVEAAVDNVDEDAMNPVARDATDTADPEVEVVVPQLVDPDLHPTPDDAEPAERAPHPDR